MRELQSNRNFPLVGVARGLVAATLLALGPPGCGSTLAGQLQLVIDGGEQRLQLAPHGRATVTVRVLNDLGRLLDGVEVHLRLEGATAGATIEPAVVRTAGGGRASATVSAGGSASFDLVATTAAGDVRAVRPVVVDPSQWFQLEVHVHKQGVGCGDSAGDVGIEVRLLEDTPCATFSVSDPPPVPAGIADAVQRVSIPDAEAPAVVRFGGLAPGRSYGVAAWVLRDDGLILVQGCRGKLQGPGSSSDDPLPVNLFLQDTNLALCLPNNVLRVETPLPPLVLSHTAAWWQALADDPLAGLLDGLWAEAAGQRWAAPWLILGGDARARVDGGLRDLVPRDPRHHLAEIARRIRAAREPRLFTTLQIVRVRSAEEPQPSQSLRARHRFGYLAFDSGGGDEAFELQQAVGVDGKRLDRQVLDGETTLDLEEGRARIAAHDLHVPLANAVLGTLLMDHFQEHTLELMWAQILECARLADGLTALVADQTPGGLTEAQRDDLRAGAESACREAITAMTDELVAAFEADLAAVGISQVLSLEGEATVTTSSDGTIRALNGQWRDVGPFSAERYR